MRSILWLIIFMMNKIIWSYFYPSKNNFSKRSLQTKKNLINSDMKFKKYLLSILHIISVHFFKKFTFNNDNFFTFFNTWQCVYVKMYRKCIINVLFFNKNYKWFFFHSIDELNYKNKIKSFLASFSLNNLGGKFILVSFPLFIKSSLIIRIYKLIANYKQILETYPMEKVPDDANHSDKPPTIL